VLPGLPRRVDLPGRVDTIVDPALGSVNTSIENLTGPSAADRDHRPTPQLISGSYRPGLQSTDSLTDQEISAPPATRQHERRWPAARQFVDYAAAGDRPWKRHPPERARRRRVDPPGDAGSVTAGCSTDGSFEQSPFINATVDTTLASGYCDVHTLTRTGIDVGSVRWGPVSTGASRSESSTSCVCERPRRSFNGWTARFHQPVGILQR
jgi:hypothetical protein